MSGYRTIPSKDTFDIDEKLGGIITIKQLIYLIATLIITYFSMLVANEIVQEPSDAIYVWGTVLFLCLVFIFGNLDKYIYIRLRYYLSSENKKLQENPALFTNIRTIEENKIITLDGRVLAILKVSPINFMLLGDVAKEAKINSFEVYLRQLVYPIAHHVQSEEVDITQYSANIIKKAQKIPNKALANYCKNHIEFLKNYLKEKNSRTKNHYIVIQVQDERYKESATSPYSPPIKKIYLKLRAFLKEFNPVAVFYGGGFFQKPKNYAKIDLVNNRIIFQSKDYIPQTSNFKPKIIENILEFSSRAELLKFAKENEKALYYSDFDIDENLNKEFMDMTLEERERVFSIEERRKNVGLSGGKTRWAFDECEKYTEVIIEKLEAASLNVKRLTNQELYKIAQIAHIPRKIEIKPNYIQIDDNYIKVIYATGYPYQISLGWLANIVDGRADYDLTMYIYPVPINEAIKTFRTAILKLSTEKKSREDFLDPETQQHLDDVTNFYSNIVSGKEKYFQASLYVSVKAKSLKYLDTALEKCKSDLAGASIDFELADYNNAKGAFSTTLTGRDMLNKKREFPSSSLAATFPHISSSIDIDPDGMFFAFDFKDSPIIIDLRKLTNQHLTILGESGSGKSYFAKSLIPRYLINGYKVFITDPDGEYIALAKKFQGSVSSITESEAGSSINPFDKTGYEINEKIRSMFGFFSILMGGITKYQQGLLEELLTELYKKVQDPTFSDFAKLVKEKQAKTTEQKIKEELGYIYLVIKPFLKTGVYGFLDKKTNIKIEKQLHVFDLREYKNDKVLKDIINYLIFDFISHRLRADKSLKALIMDEGWTMVKYPGAQEYVGYIIKDSRKYNVSFVFITQELEDMLSSDAGKSILNNTATWFIFRHKESALPLAKEVLNLTEPEYEKLLTIGIGEGLMISEKYRLFYKVKTPEIEHQELKVLSKTKDKKVQPKLRIEQKKLNRIFLSILGREYDEQKDKNLPLALTHDALTEKEQKILAQKIKKKLNKNDLNQKNKKIKKEQENDKKQNNNKTK